MSEHSDTKWFEGYLKSKGYTVDDKWKKLSRASKHHVNFFFVKETLSHILLIFSPELLRKILEAGPMCREVKLSKHADTDYPRYPQSNGKGTRTGVGVIFENHSWDNVKKLLTDLETTT